MFFGQPHPHGVIFTPRISSCLIPIAVLGTRDDVGVGDDLSLGSLHPAGGVVGGVPGPEVAGGVVLTLLLTSCCRGGGNIVAVGDVIAEVVNAMIKAILTKCC